MKIIKKDFADLTGTMALFIIPLLSYILQKVAGVIIPSKEWYWWVVILFAFILYILVNFKIVKNN